MIILNYIRNIVNWLLNIIQHPIFITAITYFTLDTIRNYKKVVGEIDSTLLFYQNIINTPIDNEEKNSKCRESLRKMAGDLGSVYNAIPLTSFFSFIKLIPCKKQVQESVKDLGSISNNVPEKDNKDKNNETIKRIRKNLRILNLWSNQ